MLYRFTRILMTIALRLFYRRVYATGIESVPGKGPVILIANHHSSLMDAAFLGVLLHRPIHYFTKGDIFRNKFTAGILKAFNMMPVFDYAGKNSVNANEETFSNARSILRKGGMILFFPEGNSHVDRKLYPLKKGAFRLAFQTADENAGALNIHIVPIGINYANPVSAETDVLVHVSTPIVLNDYMKRWRLNPSPTVQELKKESRARLLKNVLHIESDNRLSVADTCLHINSNDFTQHISRWMHASRHRFEEEKQICSVINEMNEEDAVILDALATSYNHSLKKAGLKDEFIANGDNMNAGSMAATVIGGWPLFFVGYILNAVPILIAKTIADEKVKRPDFYSWVFLTTAALLYCCWILLLLLGLLVIDRRYAIVIVIIALISGPFTIFYLNKWKMYKYLKTYNRLKKENSELINKLKEERIHIKEKIQPVPTS